MTDISEIVRMSQFGENTEPVLGLHTTVVEERFNRPNVLMSAMGIGSIQVVEDGGPVLATGQVPSICVATDWQQDMPNYARSMVRDLQRAGWQPADLAMLYPALIQNADAEVPLDDNGVPDFENSDITRNFGLADIMNYCWSLSSGEMVGMVRTNSMAAARVAAHPQRIVIVTPPEGGMSVIIPPVIMRRFTERYSTIIEMMGGIKGVVMHCGMGDLQNVETTERNGINVVNATNAPPTQHVILEAAVHPLTGIRDTRVRMKFQDHHIMMGQRKGNAMYNTIAFRFYEAFLNLFGVPDGMNRFEALAMYTMMQGAYAGGFKSASDSPMSFTQFEWKDSSVNDIVGTFFRDLGSPDPRQMDGGTLLVFLTYALTASIARDMAPPFLSEVVFEGPDIANASMRQTIRSSLINSLNPDETNIGSISNWFLPPRTMSGAMPGSRTQRVYPTVLAQSRPYDENDPNTVCRWHPDRRPLPYPADVGVLSIINRNPSIPVPLAGMVLERGEDTMPDPDGRVDRYRCVVDSTSMTQTFTAHGHEYRVARFPTSRNGVLFGRRLLALSPLSHRLQMNVGVLHTVADYCLPDPRYREDDFGIPVREGSFLGGLADNDVPGVSFIAFNGRGHARRSANPPTIVTQEMLDNSATPADRMRALMVQQETEALYGEDATDNVAFENSVAMLEALAEERAQDLPPVRSQSRPFETTIAEEVIVPFAEEGEGDVEDEGEA